MGQSSARLAYLIGQFPACNHGYLVEEITLLRSFGIPVAVASVSFADRPLEELSPEERKEVRSTFYLKGQPPLVILLDLLVAFATHPLGSARGLWWALKLAGRTGTTRNAGFYFAEAVILGRWMRKIGASHVHTHFSSSIALIATMIFPVSFSFTAHGYGELYDPSRFQLSEKIRHSLFVRGISKYGRSQLMLAAGPEDWNKLAYCPLGVDCKRLAPVKRPNPKRHGTFEIACVGRLATEKGQVFLLRAARELARAGRSVHLHLYGDGPDRGKLEELAASFEIMDAVTFHGWVSPNRLKMEYERIECLVVPSLYEGIPIVLMEAMALGIPCVAPHVTGIPELIHEGRTGLLFSAGDPDELAQAIARMMDSPELRASIALRGREHVVEQYDIVKNTQAFAGVLRDVASLPAIEPRMEQARAAAAS